MSYHSRNQVTYAYFKGRNDISASGTSAVTGSAVSTGIYLYHIRNNTDALAYVRAVDSASGTVTTSNGFPIAAGEYHYLAVRPGQYVAAILASGSGTVQCSEMTI